MVLSSCYHSALEDHVWVERSPGREDSNDGVRFLPLPTLSTVTATSWLCTEMIKTEAEHLHCTSNSCPTLWPSYDETIRIKLFIKPVFDLVPQSDHLIHNLASHLSPPTQLPSWFRTGTWTSYYCHLLSGMQGFRWHFLSETILSLPPISPHDLHSSLLAWPMREILQVEMSLSYLELN